MRRVAILLTLAACFGVTAWDGAGENTGAGRVLGGEPPSDKRDAIWVGKRVEAWQPTKAERAFDEIGWAKDLGEAQRLGKKHQRPVFLFTYDGASLSGYRC
jgi:hypothetical protein